MIEEFTLDTGCLERRYARVRVLSDVFGGTEQLRHWLHTRRNQPLGIDSETNAANPWSPEFRLRLVQIADLDEVWLLDVQALGPAFIAEIVRSHKYWVCHYVENDMRFIERGAPGAIRLEDDHVHMAENQVLLAYYDPRTVMPEDSKDGIDPRLAHLKGLKDTTTRELTPALAAVEKEMAVWWREHAPVGHRVGEKLKTWGFANVPTTEDVYRRYSAMDPLMTIRLWFKMMAKITERGQLDIVLRDLAWQWDIDRATFRGMMVDEPYARWLDRTMSELMATNAAALDQVGIKPSGSGPAVGLALQALGVPVLKWNKPTKEKPDPSPSWDKEVLKKIMTQAPGTPAADLAKLLLASRQAGKFRATYVAPMLEALEYDGRIHWSHRVIGTTTGRNSAARPPLQQQPKKDTRVRAAYRAPDGYTLVSCDLSQGEPRTMAAMSKDTNLRADIYSGDLNGAIAATAFGDAYVPADGKLAGTPSYLMRNGGKAGFLAKCYGGGDDRVTSTIGSKDAAPLRRWEERYRKLFAHGAELNRQPAVVLESGRVCPLWDRYQVPEGDTPVLNHKPSRKGLNYKAQGTQRDLLLRCWERVRAKGYARFGWFWLHDELILCVPNFMAQQAKLDLEECMTFVWHEMEFTCEATIEGTTWMPQPTEFALTDRDLIDA